VINESNETLVRPLMSFHVRLTLSDIHVKASRGVIAIGETVLIGEDGSAKVLTSGIQRKFKEISYSLQEDEDEKMKDGGEEEKSVSSEDSVNMGRNVNTQNLTDKRLRHKNVV
jgi:hypothetical protein